MARMVVRELLQVHPHPENHQRAVVALAELITRESSEILGQLKSSHERFLRMWAGYRPGRFIPQLWRWIAEDDWRTAPTEEQIAAGEAEEIRSKREREEEERARPRLIRKIQEDRLAEMEADLKLYPWHLTPEVKAELKELREELARAVES